MRIKEYKRNAREWKQQEISHERIKKNSEVFTPPALVQKMCDDYAKNNNNDWSGEMMDPSAGDGNFLSEILLRKVLFYADKGIDDNNAEIAPETHHRAIKEIYGMELMDDNINAINKRINAPEGNPNIVQGNYLELYYANPLFNPNLISTRKFRAIFGNPPFSITANPEKAHTEKEPKKLIWLNFVEGIFTQMRDDGQIYYITPSVWNANFQRKGYLNKGIMKVDCTIDEYFEIFSQVNYWSFDKAKRWSDKIEVRVDEKVEIKINEMNDLFYIPAYAERTINIHQKVWEVPTKMAFTTDQRVQSYKQRNNLRKFQNEEFHTPCFATSINNLWYGNDVVVKRYSRAKIETPKLIVGSTRDNSPILDERGEFMTTNHAYLIIDEVERLKIYQKQLQTDFYKFWFHTIKTEAKGRVNGWTRDCAFRQAPQFPMEITTDEQINKFLNLNDDEINTIKYYAGIISKQNAKRDLKTNDKFR